MSDLFEIRQTKDMGRGVFALRDIQEGVNMMDLDMRKYLMYGIVVEHVFFGKLSEMGCVDKKAQLAYYLAFADKYRKYEKHYSQKVIKYIDNLPQHYHSLICWKPHQLSMLIDKSLIHRATQKRLSLFQHFLKIKKHLQQSDDSEFIANFQSDFSSPQQQTQYYSKKKFFSANESDETEPDEEVQKLNIKEYRRQSAKVQFEEFLNFYTAVETRHIYQENSYDCDSELGALVPGLQLFNHSPQGQVVKESYCIRTIKQIKRNEQIFIAYGYQSNSQLFFNYGFMIDENFDLIKNEYISEEFEERKQQQRKQEENSCKQQELILDSHCHQHQYQQSQQDNKMRQTPLLSQQTREPVDSSDSILKYQQIKQEQLTQQREKLADKYNLYYSRQMGNTLQQQETQNQIN